METMAVILVLRAVAALLKTQASAIVRHPPLDQAELADLQGQAQRLRAVAIRLEAEVAHLEAEVAHLEAETLAVDRALGGVSTLVTPPPLDPAIPAMESLSAMPERTLTARVAGVAGRAARATPMEAARDNL